MRSLKVKIEFIVWGETKEDTERYIRNNPEILDMTNYFPWFISEVFTKVDYDYQTCPKCLSENIKTLYHKSGKKYDVCVEQGDGRFLSDNIDEHLHYYCQSCGFDWLGPVAQKKN